MQKFEQVLGWIVKIGLWLIPLLPLYISSSMLFPYITGKNFTFRIIVEIIFAAWIGLAILKAEYRPRLTPLFKIITIFVGIVFLADLLSPNPYRSFFSNYERMEGFMMIGHLYLYFVMLVSMFRTRRDWLVFFHVSLAASIGALYYGLLQRLGLRQSIQGAFRVDSTIGNPSYFAAYLLFHVWLLAILAYQYRRVWWRVALYGALLLAELVMIYFTATRGVVLALAAVAIPLAAALVIFWHWVFAPKRQEKHQEWSGGRVAAAVILVFTVTVPLIFWSIRSSDVIQENQALRRLTNYSLQEGSIQNRVMIWGMSLKAVAERPLLGWGQENYYLVFQKYFNPGLYAAEPWFDRSHNAALDWAVHTGLLGLAAYLGIFAVAMREIIRAMKRERAIFFEGLLLIGLFATYFLQNLFVFDNLNSYILFFAFLAYVQQIGQKESDIPDGRGHHARDAGRFPYAVAGMAVTCIVVMVWGYSTILKPMWKSMALIRALGALQARVTLPQTRAVFADVLAYRSFGDTEAREQLANVARGVAGSESGTPEERRQFIEFALDELRRETAHPAKDVKHLLFIESILDRSLALDIRYAVEAEAAGQEAILLSPTKQAAYFELAQLYLSLNRLDDALHMLQQAWGLDRSFRQAAANVWTVAVFAKNQAAIDEVRKSFALADFEETYAFNIARAYQQVEDYNGAREAFAELVESSPLNPQYHATYAALLARAGKIAEARKEVEEAMRMDPSFEKEGKAFLQQLQ
ncbi:MAG: O-antigen ligase family protein [Candidatus Sungiibacteriota bacterium]